MLSSFKKSQKQIIRESDNKYISEDKIIKNGYCFDCNTKIDEIYKRSYHCNLFYKKFYK